ncbi:MAG: hypothetical protein H6R14_2801 [Proteobacteria bacterium]|nr:hypothetical protein [Pseudomonadota bacterium]
MTIGSKRKILGTVLLPFAVVAAGSAIAGSKTYTLDADFSLGTLSGVNHDAPNNNQLQLSTVGTTFPVMWVANAGEDTVSKFDTKNNKELARYHTWFGPKKAGGAYSGPAPSRTSVDIDGNAYVLNRHFDGRKPLLIKILAEGGIDRNGNGVIDTSTDTSGNGKIEDAEMFRIQDLNGNGKIDDNEITDERVAWAVEVGVASGLGRSLCIGGDGNLWVGMYNTRQYFKVSGVDGSQIAGPIAVPSTPYGCLIDRDGNLWSADLGSTLMKIENANSNTGPYNVSAKSNCSNYGIGLGNGKVYLGNGNRQYDIAANGPSCTAIPGASVGSLGIVVDGGGNIIIGTGMVQKIRPDGTVAWTAPLQAGGGSSIGIQVDGDNNVWQIGMGSNRVHKYNGVTGAAMGVYDVGREPYTYSDATGLVSRNVTTGTGTWTVTQDGGGAGVKWGTISWNAAVPTGASISVEARTAETEAGLSGAAYSAVTSGTNFSKTGRYIQVRARLNENTSNQSPVLYDLTVSSLVTTCDVDKDGDIDMLDINQIRAGIGQTPVSGDPRDATGDGKITINDVRACTLKCTRASCATN